MNGEKKEKDAILRERMKKAVELLKKEQDIIREMEDPEFFQQKCGKPTHNVHVHISIPASGIDLQKIFQAEQLLHEAGVSFDTGYGGGQRDWEFDWSLRGAFVKLRKVLSEEEQKANLLERILMPYNQDPYLPAKVLVGSHEDLFVVVYGKKDEYQNIVHKRIINAGGEALVKQTEEKEDFIVLYKWNGTFIKVSYTENESGY